MPFNLPQTKSLAIVPHVTAPLSMFGSACIIKAILSEKEKRESTYFRILLSMSCVDFTVSFWYALSTWPVPKGTPGVWGAVGNSASCTAQGFFIQGNAGIPCFNASLAIYTLLFCRYEWREEKFKAIEPFMLGIPFLISIGTAFAGLPLKLYNNANLWCWIAPFPAGCKDSATYGEDATCIRGDNAWIYRWAFAYGPVWTSIIIAIVCMGAVYWTVLQHERDIDKFQADGLALRKQSKRVAWQAFWYVIAFYISWIPPTLVRLLQTIPQTRGKVYFPIILCMAIFLPMQGFFNFIVYSRSRYYKYRKDNESATAFDAMCYAAFSITRVTRKKCEFFGHEEEPATTESSIPMSKRLTKKPVSMESKTSVWCCMLTPGGATGGGNDLSRAYIQGGNK